ncbi:LuxR C-terminal-related transcriptional regulator [Streptomyces sp. ZAF1911]|uniref:helix-turn-helix transcriptional regulator n=1 Tax=Streptomyces sp. ZAF1911 TaxID=2944129 RepID=UPI00237B82EF|nr:LuxR C-terminal-related transcriptional regulator [Streptomyces sp. ZAF1911]MDD9375760.1 LuxR C-terminal-related transcriptional regulator [Streptomyces sp. ZAF1911]
MLQSLGLDELAHEIYRFALGRQGCRLESLLSGVHAPEAEVRRSVDRLLELSLLRSVAGTLVPSRPPLALRSLIQREQSEILRRQQEFVHIKAAMDQLSEEYEYAQGPGLHAGWERLDSHAEIHARMEHLAAKTTGECVYLLPSDMNGTESLHARRPLDQHMLDRGVSVWNIYRESIYNHRAGLAYARWLAESGGKVGTLPTVPIWFVVYDRTTALVSVDPEDPGAGAVQVTGAGYLACLVALFERLCESMTLLDAPDQSDLNEPSSLEKELLRLMGQGLTDEAVCKKLGVGLRTVRRMIADLMERMGARSRFEAGAMAVELGWYRPCSCNGDRPQRGKELKAAQRTSEFDLSPTVAALV